MLHSRRYLSAVAVSFSPVYLVCPKPNQPVPYFLTDCTTCLKALSNSPKDLQEHPAFFCLMPFSSSKAALYISSADNKPATPRTAWANCAALSMSLPIQSSLNLIGHSCIITTEIFQQSGKQFLLPSQSFPIPMRYLYRVCFPETPTPRPELVLPHAP